MMRVRERVPLMGRVRRHRGGGRRGVVLRAGHFVITSEKEEVEIGNHSIEREPFRDIPPLRNLWEVRRGVQRGGEETSKTVVSQATARS
jgi:hypothetical protein